MKDLLAKLGSLDSSAPVNEHGGQLIDAINNRKQHHGQMVTEEMKVILEERDNAVAKVSFVLFTDAQTL